MTKVAYTHVAFADESNWNQGQFRSIALVSAAVEHAREFHRKLDSLRESFGRREFKWKNANQRHGIALADFFFLRLNRMRVDVLIWDMEDPRHKDVRGRDDKANFARMYYHLLHNVLKQRWPDGASWLICPDEQKEVDWSTLEQCLAWKSWAVEENILSKCGALPELREYYNIDQFRPVSSKKVLLVQLADMFAGVGAYSYTEFDKYVHWKNKQDATPSLFKPGDCGEPMVKLSKRDRERMRIVHHIRQEAGKKRLRLSLKSSRGLCTKNPNFPLNFWLYTPQRAEDKAPVR